jgi:hypothetical protein
MSYGNNTLGNVYVDKMHKYSELAREIRRVRRMRVKIIPIIVSSLGAVYPDTLTELGEILKCNEKEKKKLGRRISEAALMGSFRMWRGHMKELAQAEDRRVGAFARLEESWANEEVAIDDEVEQGQEAERAQRSEARGESRGEGDEPHDLSDEIVVEGRSEEEEEGREEVEDDEDSIEEGQEDRETGERRRGSQRGSQDEQGTWGANMKSFLGDEPQEPWAGSSGQRGRK